MTDAAPLPGRLANSFAPDKRRRFSSRAALIETLFTRPRNGDDELAVFLGDEVFALAG
jgi:hypothetical protein